MESGANDTVIHAEGVWRSYGPGAHAYDAVRGVSLTVARGEVFGLLGTNGAGKTSTIELLEGLAPPTRGSIRMFGRHDPFRDRARVRPRTGVMLQEGGFANDLTVEETLRMWAGCTSTPRPVAEAAGVVGLTGRLRTAVKGLSGGERRRLDLALAVLGSPELLFLDEPTTGMDPEGRRETWSIIRGLRDMGTTVLMTTHYLEEAEQLADRLAIMHRGTIAEEGTPAGIVARFPSSLGFALPPGVDASLLPALDEAVAQVDPGAARAGAGGPGGRTGDRVRLTTDRLQRTAAHVLDWAREEDIELIGFNARSASLEEVFLQIADNGAADGGRTHSERRAG
ncbi:ABC transporter ATP-binding protein [Nocardiopsis halophila]|uniref:ABC transporter ATP-binding protein n=1 Tax=Nocardiopsis halophila TaxID=141692 RepID=UPI000585AC82|nr:ABC transporter ATP-binding protein [Nocardiopsis halophila]